ncbi:MAG: tetratricopeptide repeat protein [Gammaproteobacteria bacterium]|nr:tetratricopeptide repeat protein [Gammaproteobacteria bacterium]
MNPSPYILEGTSDNFQHLVIENSRKGLVIVDFWAPWAGPSLRQREILSDLARSNEGRFLLVSVNTDEQKSLAERFAVRSLPSFKLFRHGDLVAEYHGVQPEADYPRIVGAYVTKKLDSVSAAAVTAWQSGNTEQALQMLAEAAVESPEMLAYPALMAKILLREGREEDAHALLSALPEDARDAEEVSGLLAHLDLILTARHVEKPGVLQQDVEDDPRNAEARYRLAASLLVADEVEPALEHLLYLSHHHAGYRNGIARKAMRAVLDMLDPENEAVARYRRELYRLNY